MSHIPRLFIAHPLQADQSVNLSADQSKYLTRVMRLGQGATVRAFNGHNGEWRCTLSQDGKIISIHPEVQTREQESCCDLSLLFAPIKKARTDFIIEKATELGVSSIRPVFTAFTQSNRVRIDRFESLAIEAAEQTERMDLPVIHEAAPLTRTLSEWDRSRPILFCDESAEAAPMSRIEARLASKGVGILIGPEGGFSQKERETLRSLDFVMPITLGPRILRAETAVVSALTLWQSLVGDWRNSPYLPER